MLGFKKILVSFSLLCFGFIFFLIPVKAADLPELIIFYSQYCPHCEKEQGFLTELTQKYPNLKIKKFQVDNNKDNQKLFQQTAKQLGIEQLGVPLTVIGNQYFLGYENDTTTGQAIELAIQKAFSSTKPKPVITSVMSSDSDNLPQTITVPIFGTLKITDLSLPVLTIIIGALDGFNPCAMWTLVFLISLLLGIKNRSKMWVLGLTFIITSAVIYFLFLAAWLNFFLLVGYTTWVRYLIAVVAMGAGGYYLYDYWKNNNGSCRVMANQNRQQFFTRLKTVVNKKQFLLAFLGIIVLAIAVNMVELLCSAGLPAVYTRVLSYAKLPVWQYYGYLGLYIIVFMLDDIIVFLTAMLTLKTVGLEGKYARYSHLIGGGLILLIGVLLLFKPEWLMFG